MFTPNRQFSLQVLVNDLPLPEYHYQAEWFIEEQHRLLLVWGHFVALSHTRIRALFQEQHRLLLVWGLALGVDCHIASQPSNLSAIRRPRKRWCSAMTPRQICKRVVLCLLGREIAFYRLIPSQVIQGVRLRRAGQSCKGLVVLVLVDNQKHIVLRAGVSELLLHFPPRREKGTFHGD